MSAQDTGHVRAAGAPLRTPLASRRKTRIVQLLLTVAFLDELLFGTREAAWPTLQAEFGLSLSQIGWLLTIPAFVSAAIEPVLALLATGSRLRRLVLIGGLFFAISSVGLAVAPSFWWLLCATTALYLASGVFVGLGQASLMADHPDAGDRLMLRWTLAGSWGILIAPVALVVAFWVGLGWRPLFVGFGLVAAVLTLRLLRAGSFGTATSGTEPGLPFSEGFRRSLRLLRRASFRRCFLTMLLADFPVDILSGFLAIYLVQAGLPIQSAALGYGLWIAAMLLGNLGLLRYPVRHTDRFLSRSSLLAAAAFAAFLLAPTLFFKLLALVLLGVSTTGWYPLLQARLYAEEPDAPGVVIAASGLFDLTIAWIPAGVGLLADRVGLETTLWCLAATPIAMFLLVRRAASSALPRRPGASGAS